MTISSVGILGIKRETSLIQRRENISIKNIVFAISIMLSLSACNQGGSEQESGAAQIENSANETSAVQQPSTEQDESEISSSLEDEDNLVRIDNPDIDGNNDSPEELTQLEGDSGFSGEPPSSSSDDQVDEPNGPSSEDIVESETLGDSEQSEESDLTQSDSDETETDNANNASNDGDSSEVDESEEVADSTAENESSSDTASEQTDPIENPSEEDSSPGTDSEEVEEEAEQNTSIERTEICEAQTVGRCWYVTPEGVGQGTYEDPGNIPDIIPQLSQGDYLYLFSGVYDKYHEANNQTYIVNINKYINFSNPQPTEEYPVTIKGYPDEEAIIRGNRERGCVFIDGISNLVIDGIIVEECFNSGIRLGGDVPEENVIFRNIEIRNIDYNDNSGFLTVHSYKNVLVEHSSFHDYYPKPETGQIGSYLKFFRAIDVEVANNTFYGQGNGIYYKHGEAELEKGGTTKIHSNEFLEMDGEGIYTNQNRTEIYNNLFLDNGGVFVHKEDGTKAIFTTDVHIHHNTFVNSQVILKNGSNDGGYLGLFGLGAKKAIIENNVLLNSEYDIWRYGDNEEFDIGIELTSNNNCFYHEDESFQVGFFASDSWGDSGGSYLLSEWQQLGYDIDSSGGSFSLDANYRVLSGGGCEEEGWLSPAE